MAKRTSKHIEWLSLIEVSGPFLTVSMLDEVFPQGLDKVETRHKVRLRSAYDEWCDAVDQADPQLKEIHEAWCRFVLQEFLGYDDTVLVSNLEQKTPYEGRPANGVGRYSPQWFVVDSDESPRSNKAKRTPKLFVDVLPPGTKLDEAKKGDFWSVSPLEKMIIVCREHEGRIGLLTNGEQWMLVNAPRGSISSDASWYARLWFQEPLTLKAFSSLLDIRRCFGPANQTLPALLKESLNRHEEITNTLGEQVKNAVEVLVQRLDQADAERGRNLLPKSPAELYEASLTVMMRLVFILCAEQRGLLLLDDPIYDQNYAASTLREKLQEAADQHGEEILEHRLDAWPRLLSLFRMVFDGSQSADLPLPALGGALFDPDRFPFLEGREPGTSWRNTACSPLPIDNRTVLHLMTALEVLEQGSGALLLSYRALDVEQIGHVYEGLLEYTVKRLDQATLGFEGTRSAKNPNIPLAELESAALDGEDSLVALIRERTRKSEAAIRKALAKPLPTLLETRLRSVCAVGQGLIDRVKPFGNLLRLNAWEYPIVYGEGSYTVTLGPDRRETGTHYTPKSLTEEIVKTTLEPIVYEGFSDGKKLDKCRLKSPEEILSLKICDPAMGSGAFLVQVCRWLGARLVESWDAAAKSGKLIDMWGRAVDTLGGGEKMSEEPGERLTEAMRLVAERCLYGVDINPLAVELAKLSIWLTTMSKGRPFEYLEHNFRCGDSLLGLHHLDQLTRWTMTPAASGTTRQPTFYERTVYEAVAEAYGLREELRSISVRDIRDIEKMTQLHRKAQAKTAKIRKLADAMTAAVLSAKGGVNETEESLDVLAGLCETYLKEDDSRTVQDIDAQTAQRLAVDLPPGKPNRVPFHWAIEFPEVFASYGGFDAIVGNPPFLGGKRITGALGSIYRNWLVAWIAEGTRGSADLVTYFFLRAYGLLRKQGAFGLLAVNTISEGDTRQVGLERLLKKETSIFAAFPNEPWPGTAAVVTSRVHLFKGTWNAPFFLSGRATKTISAFLSDQDEWTPRRLQTNFGKSFQGSIVLGLGFTIPEDSAMQMIEADPKNQEVIFPYIIGEDVNTHPLQKPSRWVINFWDWSEEKAAKYNLPFQWILEQVKPERQRRHPDGTYVLRLPIPIRWWQYSDKRPALYHAIGHSMYFQKHPHSWDCNIKPLKRVLFHSFVSKYLAFAFVPSCLVYAGPHNVFPLEQYASLAILQSIFHEAWAWKQGSRLGASTLRYTPSDIFETFPFPPTLDGLEEIGQSYHDLRAEIMKSEWIGLTKLYNRFHSPEESDERIAELRELHRRMDEAVAAAYGWDDLDLDHDFHSVGYLPVNDRTRYTISEKARLEVLRRLSKLNRERYNEEQARSDAEKPTKKKNTKKSKPTPLIDEE